MGSPHAEPLGEVLPTLSPIGLPVEYEAHATVRVGGFHRCLQQAGQHGRVDPEEPTGGEHDLGRMQAV